MPVVSKSITTQSCYLFRARKKQNKVEKRSKSEPRKIERGHYIAVKFRSANDLVENLLLRRVGGPKKWVR